MSLSPFAFASLWSVACIYLCVCEFGYFEVYLSLCALVLLVSIVLYLSMILNCMFLWVSILCASNYS